MFGLLLFLFLFGLLRAQDPIKYILNFDSSILVCPDEESQGFLDTSQLEVDRNESCAFLNGKVDILKKLEDDTMVEIKVFKAAPGGHSEMVYSYEVCELCRELGDPNSTNYKNLKYFGFPDDCPIAPGSYPVDDLIADTSDMPINSANEGRYQIELNVYRDPEKKCKGDMPFIGCAKLDFVIEPQFIEPFL